MNTYRNFILDAGDVEEGLDPLPQFPPWPGAELQVLAQVALDNLEGDPIERQLQNCKNIVVLRMIFFKLKVFSSPLFLQLLVFLTGEVTTDVGLEPRYDLGQPIVTQLFHLTQDTSAEEYLLAQKGVLVHRGKEIF